jgi:hypothetical protein
MRSWVDGLLVTIAVLGAAAYAFHSLAPRPWRDWVYRLLGLQTFDGAGGCGGCGDCSDSKSGAKGKVVSVPLRKIGRRSAVDISDKPRP